MKTKAILAAALVCTLPLTGCTPLGPKTMAVDRFDYGSAIADSWKQQTLLNIVKLRYMDLPVFVDVSSIVAGYTMETSGNVGGGVDWLQSGRPESSLSLGVRGTFTDRPTITYVPMTGEKFMHGLLAPIDPKRIFFLLQSGYPADFMLGLTVESLNGLRNRSAVGGIVREADPEFIRVLDLLRDVQAAGALGMRVEEDKVKGSTAVVFFRRDDVPADVAEKSAEIRRLLKLAAEPQKFVLTYSPMRGTDNELAVYSRSMMQIMGTFSTYLDVPEAHLKDRSAIPTVENLAQESQPKGARIYSGKNKPASAFAAVYYRDHWFWVENGDWLAKRALTAVMFFFSLLESGETGKLPLITIPAQ